MPRKSAAANLPLGHEAPTPLAYVVGFNTAEETYDKLTLKEQLIIDLLILDWKQSDIAEVMECSRHNVFMLVHSIRVKLANEKLRQILEMRAEYREKGRI